MGLTDGATRWGKPGVTKLDVVNFRSSMGASMTSPGYSGPRNNYTNIYQTSDVESRIAGLSNRFPLRLP